MIHSYLMQFYTQLAPSIGLFFLRRYLLGGVAVAFTLLLALSPLPGSAPVYAQEAAASTSYVNINTADAATLAAGLKGVGQVRAQDIVRHRETFGAFVAVEELLEVKGIGQSTLDKNRELIKLEILE